MVDTNSPPHAVESDAIAYPPEVAARLVGVSSKTLTRLADAGEPVGRVRLGRRVVFVRSALEQWLASRLAATS